MTSVSSASDIWSVGCLAIELLTGSPPYSELQPMSALFRVVQVRLSLLRLKHHHLAIVLSLFNVECSVKASSLSLNISTALNEYTVDGNILH